MNFIKTFFASLLAFITGLSLIILFALIFLLALIAGLSPKETVKVDPNSILHIRLDYTLSEQTTSDPWSSFDIQTLKPTQNLGLNDVLKNIRKAQADDNIKGIFLDVSVMPNGMATTEAIRNQLIEFKKSGKFIISYAEVMTNKAFYLATVADKIYLNPMGLVEFAGLSSMQLFLKNLLDKLNIEAQVFYAGKYKSASEPFRLEKMSEPNREQVTAYVNSIYHHQLEKIAESRSIPVALLDSIADNLLVRRAEDALKYGLIDELAYYDEVLDELKKRTGKKEDEKIASLSLKKYNNAPDPNKKDQYQTDKLAIVYAEGDIVDGKGEVSNIGSERMTKLLRKIRQDKDVKALVLRVNSPGGSALASEVILREIALLKKKMPVVVSMGDVAASGGYYISCYADTIVAEPTTITGSIGVFGVIPNMQGFFNKHLGITFDNVKTGKYSDLGNIVKPMTPEEKLIIQQGIDTVYHKFKKRVAEGRKMNMALVDSLAQGRVYTGIQAKNIGLVDVLGGINVAITIAAEKAGIKEYRIKEYPEQEEPLEKLLRSLAGETETYFLKTRLGEFYPFWREIEYVKKMQGIQARLPFNIIIQ